MYDIWHVSDPLYVPYVRTTYMYFDATQIRKLGGGKIAVKLYSFVPIRAIF